MTLNHLFVKIAIYMLIVEASLVALFVIINYLIRLYHYLLFRHKPFIEEKIKEKFFEYSQTFEPVSKKDMKFFNKNILAVFNVIEEYFVSVDLIPGWEKLQEELTKNLFYPKGRKLYNSWRPYKRYYAARCFLSHYQEKDAEMVIELIKDPILLVSLNASRIAFKYKSEKLINASIDIYSQLRKIRQSIYATIAQEADEEVEAIIVDRLIHEKNAYVRAFCYRLLQQVPATEKLTKILLSDLHSKILDLRIAALNYAGYNAEYHYLLKDFLNDEQWEMRAIAADWVGRVKYISALEALGNRLYDHEWWVRIRSAEALSKMGPEGIKILKSQSAVKDKYAYEAALQVLTNLHPEIIK